MASLLANRKADFILRVSVWCLTRSRVDIRKGVVKLATNPIKTRTRTTSNKVNPLVFLSFPETSLKILPTDDIQIETLAPLRFVRAVGNKIIFSVFPW